jgi:hypothetical protein
LALETCGALEKRKKSQKLLAAGQAAKPAVTGIMARISDYQHRFRLIRGARISDAA